MRKLYFLFLLLIPMLSFGQTSVQTQPKDFGWKAIHKGSQLGGTITTTVDTSDAFDISKYIGVTTIWLNPDTTGGGTAAANPDTCWTVYLEIYNDQSGEWGQYAAGATTSRIDTLKRTLVNVAVGSKDVYFNLPDYVQYAYGNQARIIINIGTGNKAYWDAWVGGQ